MEIFGIATSYLFILMIPLTVKKQKLDAPALLLFFFICYILLSCLWGATLRENFRFSLPFFMYFSARTVLTDKRQIKTMVGLGICGFILPIVGSFLLIMKGQSVSMEVYETGVIRYKGLYLKTHSFAHSMMVFIVLITIFYDTINTSLRNYINKICLSSFIIITAMALFNIYKSVTRTVFLGLGLFVSIYLAGRRKYILLFSLAGLAVLKLVTSSRVQELFFDIINPLTGKGSWRLMGSGRLGGWHDILYGFLNAPIEYFFLGVGIGNESRGTFGGAHSDWLSLFVSLGVIGVLFYSFFLVSLVLDILRSPLEKSTKSLYIAFVFSVITMNMASNSYLSRFDLGQFFFLILSTFYGMKNLSLTGHSFTTTANSELTRISTRLRAPSQMTTNMSE